MATVVIQIGNSDNKLTQLKWSKFVEDVGQIVENYASQIHFTGGSSFNSQYQNACFVCDVGVECQTNIKQALTNCRKHYRQDSAAIVTGETEFV